MEETIIIITAMKEEADLIIKKFNLQKVKNLKNIHIFETKRNERKIVLILSGIGKIQAAIATTFALKNYENIIKIVNIGIAGKVENTDVKIGDVFLPNTFIQSDMHLPFDGGHLDYAKKPIFLDYAIGKNYDLQKFGLILNGVCVTADKFIDNEKDLAYLRKNFGASICEMEVFSILSVAREYDMLSKCIVIKAISDGADNEAKDTHMDNLNFAMENSVSVLDFILD